MIESGRWHDGRLWFAHRGAGDVLAVDLLGRAEVMASGPTGMGWAIAWLPEGGLLVSGEDLALVRPDGSTGRYSEQGGNEVIVDPAGHVYSTSPGAVNPQRGGSAWSRRTARPAR